MFKRRLGLGLASALIAGAALSAQVAVAAPNTPPAPGANGHRGPHVLPFGLTPVDRGNGPTVKLPNGVAGTASPQSAPAGAHLTYNGGRVVSSVQVVQVLWGTGTYLPQTTSTAHPSVATFFQGITTSNYMDWLDSEYNTVNNSFNGTKTNQHIGHGGFAQQITITPSSAANGSTVDDTVIQSEVSAQIRAGHLPPPTVDANGNTNTLYALFFRHGQTITQGGTSSLTPGGFCAYHGTVPAGGGLGEFYYSVLPDLVGVAGCGNGTDFQNTTSVMSHELTETLTDAEVGLATTASGPPLAWYDNSNGEIGDICNAQQGNFGPLADGQTYSVQYEFSNAQNNCFLPTYQPQSTSDFSVTASPASVSIAAGSSGSTTISTITTAGSAQTVSLTVSGAPSGVTATLSPASVTSGQSSTLSISTTASAAAGTYALTITGTGASASHATGVGLTVTGGVATGGITNGGFETGNLTGWTPSGASASVVSAGCHGGSFCGRLGSTSPTNGDSTISQTFAAPSGATGISLWYKMTCPDTVTYDWALATLADNTAGTTATLLSKTCTTNSWTNLNGLLVSGHSYTLTLTSHDDNYSADPSFTLFDDAAITSAAPPATGVTNGGFEAGSFTGWTTSGASASVVSAGCHGGSFCARLGSTSPTNGDSTVAQTFTVPSGKSQLSLWYKMTCPDTVTYDWATVTLKNNATAVTTSVLPKTCSTNGTWVNVTATVSAGTSYTLTLTSHDDNYSADPSYTLYDDVVLN